MCEKCQSDTYMETEGVLNRDGLIIYNINLLHLSFIWFNISRFGSPNLYELYKLMTKKNITLI